MRIIDITDILNDSKTAHNYNFNPSIANYPNSNIYVVTYRHVNYRITDGNTFECYQIWWEPDILLRQNLDESIDRSLACKYRKTGLNNQTITFQMGMNTKAMSPNNLYFDGTGLLVFELIDDIIVPKYHIDNMFPSEYNQDTRIQYNGSDGSFNLTYNTFEEDHGQQYIHMVTRKMFIDLQTGIVQLLPESYMLLADHKPIEKNCVYNYASKDVLYEINKNFTIYEYGEHSDTQTITRKLQPQLAALIDFYGQDVIQISLGSPPIPFGNNFIAMGHLRVLYRGCNHFNSKFADFINSDISDSLKHKDINCFIYFCFIFEFNSQYDLLSMSYAFLPSDYNRRHRPYLLAFPCGLTSSHIQDQFIMSYGEGDIRSKLALISKQEIEQLLVPIQDITPETYDFKLLITSAKPAIIQHVGYFNQFNCGDDAFQLVFQYMNQQLYPKIHCQITPKCQSNNQDYLLILGPGDVINPYFIDPIKTEISNINRHISPIALGVGVPYESQMYQLSMFSRVYLRNVADVQLAKNQLAKYHIYHVPDLAFLLSRFSPILLSPVPITVKKSKQIGVSLARPHCNKNYPQYHIKYLDSIVQTISQLIMADFEVNLIPFCISDSQGEDDRIMNTEIMQRLSMNPDIDMNQIHSHLVPKSKEYVNEILKLMQKMDCMISSRFHAHVFSIMLNKPFISLSPCRKCKQLMMQYDLTDNTVDIEVGEHNIPIQFDSQLLYTKTTNLIQHYDKYTQTLSQIHKSIQCQLSEFLEHWGLYINSEHYQKFKSNGTEIDTLWQYP